MCTYGDDDETDDDVDDDDQSTMMTTITMPTMMTVMTYMLIRRAWAQTILTSTNIVRGYFRKKR